MAINIQPPNPGERVRSDLFKQLIQAMVDLDTRLSALEVVTPGANGRLSISRIVPSDAVVGDLIQIIGVNFGLPSDNIVTFDGGNSVIPTSGNDRQLNVQIPALDLGGATQKTVTVAVSGGVRGFDSASLTVHAVQATIPAGTITVSPGTIPANIQSGADAIFPFTIEARTNLDETYNLTTVLPSVPAGQTAWSAVVTSDAQGTKPITQPLLIPAPRQGQPSTAQVFVKVTIPQNTPVTSPFVTLNVTSVHNPPPGLGSPTGGWTLPFQFNAQQQPPQTIRFAISSFTGSGVKGDLTSGISFPLPTPSTPPIDGVSLIFQNLKAGQYNLTLEWKDKTNSSQGWVASFGGAPNITPGWPIVNKVITMNTAGDGAPEKVAVVAGAGATRNTLILTVRAAGANANTDYGILNQDILPA
jgi:IPT/TIG domain